MTRWGSCADLRKSCSRTVSSSRRPHLLQHHRSSGCGSLEFGRSAMQKPSLDAARAQRITSSLRGLSVGGDHFIIFPWSMLGVGALQEEGFKSREWRRWVVALAPGCGVTMPRSVGLGGRKGWGERAVDIVLFLVVGGVNRILVPRLEGGGSVQVLF